MVAGLLIVGGYQTLGLLAFLVSARIGVVSVSVRRPTRPKPKETP